MFRTALVPRGDPKLLVDSLPRCAGVGQFLGPNQRSLLIGQTADLRRFAATHLGLGPAAKAGRRPPVNLRPVAVAFRFAPTSSGFQQRLLFERLMAEQVEPAARRDLKEPAFLRLDLDDRFPRLSVETEPRRRTALYGPFRDKAQAARAREAIHKRHPLRPCDYTFEPEPALPLGLACLFAQVRSCSAPCLSRIAEEEYRALAARVAARLADPRHRVDADGLQESLPPWIARFDGHRALVAERSADGIELYPILEGRVLEEAARSVAEDELADALSALVFEAPADQRDDLPWLAAWLAAPRRRGIYLGWRDDVADLAAALRETLGPPA